MKVIHEFRRIPSNVDPEDTGYIMLEQDEHRLVIPELGLVGAWVPTALCAALLSVKGGTLALANHTNTMFPEKDRLYLITTPMGVDVEVQHDPAMKEPIKHKIIPDFDWLETLMLHHGRGP